MEKQDSWTISLLDPGIKSQSTDHRSAYPDTKRTETQTLPWEVSARLILGVAEHESHGHYGFRPSSVLHILCSAELCSFLRTL